MSKVWVEQLPSGNSGRFRHPLTGGKERAGSFANRDAALGKAAPGNRRTSGY